MSFSCCAPLGEEARLLRDCYPPKKQLIPAPSLSSGVPDMDSYKPSSQELSKMTYYATNKRGKLNVLARELDERVRKEVRDAGNGYTRSRISLLISLAILKSLVTECKRDIPLFASYILRIVENSMTLAIKGGGVIKGAKSASVDLEIAVRAGAAFTAFVTFADGNALGADDSILSTYISVLKQFSTLSLNAETSSHLNDSSSGSGSGEAKQKDARDHETRNRTRLVGLAALAAAVHSELMFAGNSEFGSQVKVMVPALLENTWLGDSDTLQNEIARATIDTSPSPYFAEFSARPALANRRAPSLYAHIAGEKGPMTSDVIGAALGTLRDLVRQCYAQQTSQVIDVVIAWLDRGRWADVSRCSLLLEALTTFSNLRYRYAYPMALVEELLKFDQEEVSETHQRASSLITILTNLLSSEKLSMPGLSTTKLLHDLLSVIIRQSKAGDDISLLLSSIGSLCTHIYYGDQVNDLVEVIVNRIAAVQSAAPHLQLDGSLGPPARKTNSRASSFTSSAEQRDTVVNALIACTNAIMLTIPSKADPRVADGRVRRNAVSVEVWQETLPLLCDRSFAVRSEYAKTLLLYLRQEIPLLTDDSPPGTPQEWKTTTTSPLIRFLNALNATLYTLAISSRLGYSGPAIAPPTPHESPKPTSVHTNNNITDDRPVDSPVEDSPPHLSSSPRPVGIVGRRASKLVALPLHRSETFTAAPNTVYDQATAGPFDYTVIAEALEAVFGNAPIRALFCGVPMMLALDRETSAPGEIAAERRKACKEVLVRAWSIALQSVGESIDAVSLVSFLCRPFHTQYIEDFTQYIEDFWLIASRVVRYIPSRHAFENPYPCCHTFTPCLLRCGPFHFPSSNFGPSA